MAYPAVVEQRVALVVEDEFFLALEAIGLLQDLGYSVMACDSADKAIAILHDRQDVRLVFTGIEIPGPMNGLALAGHIEATWPKILILITSKSTAPCKEELPEKVRFVVKPYDRRQVKRALESMRGGVERR